MSSVNQRIFGRFLFGSSVSNLTDVIVESSRDRIPNSGIFDLKKLSPVNNSSMIGMEHQEIFAAERQNVQIMMCIK